MVEEEIPPSSQLENNAGTTETIKTRADNEAIKEEEDQSQHFANCLMEEHLQLLFEIRKNQDDQVHS